VSSPNEPGNGNGPPPAGPRSSGPAPVSNPGRSNPGPLTDRGDVPPWQRGAKGRGQPPPPRRPEAPAGPHAPSGVEERINRFISGPAAAKPQAPESDAPAPPPSRADVPGPARTEAPVRSEGLRSELPDLSTPMPRPPRPKPATERPGGEPVSSVRTNRMQVRAPTGGPVRASMQIRRVDPWSVLKVSLVLSVALFFVWMIAVAFLYLVLGGMGVWAKLNSNVGDLLNNTSNSELVSSGTIFGGAALIGLANIVLLTAMATVGAFIYNLTTDLVGGVEVTLADRD
jgi:Transmembrane domain of unknown function (DUF3566)